MEHYRIKIITCWHLFLCQPLVYSLLLLTVLLPAAELLKSEGANRQQKRSKLIGDAVGDVGPSMLLSSLSQACCFFLGNS